jgi:hypothetical protein
MTKKFEELHLVRTLRFFDKYTELLPSLDYLEKL